MKEILLSCNKEFGVLDKLTEIIYNNPGGGKIYPQ